MKLKMPTSLQELLPALGVSQNWKLHSVPPDTWEIPTQNKIWACANNGINQNPPCWLCSFFFFFQEPDCFSPNEQKNQLPPVDFISAATVFVGLQCPLKKTGLESHAAVLRGERKKKKKEWKLFWCKNKKRKEEGAQGTRIKGYKDT